MAMSGGGEDDGPIVGINVTPLVDVCLVLVIIFMVTAPLLSEPMFPIDLPEARSSEGKEEEKIIVTLAPDRYAVRHREFRSIEPALKRLHADILTSREKVVILKADKKVYHGVLVTFMQSAKESGAKSLTIATERKKG